MVPASDDVELDAGPCAVTYVRSARPHARRIRFGEPVFLFARGASRVTVGPMSLSPAEIAVVPRAAEAALTSESSACDLLLVRPRPVLIEATADAYGVPLPAMTAVFDRWHRLGRERWLDEVQHRYFFERIVCNKNDNVATRFLEMELVKEIYFLVTQGTGERVCSPPFDEREDLGHRAVRHVEAHLFESLSLDGVAEELGTSRATLVRRFRAATGKAPAEYVRERRLDEAHALLARRSATVTEVALTVGYENAGAFAQAFRRRFGRSPSSA